MAKRRTIPHVLLLVDTAGAFGRGIVEGVGRYALENGPWSIQFEYRALDSSLPQWLKRWQGDGIISRTSNPEQVKLLLKLGKPFVELLGHLVNGMPEVGSDRGVASMAVQHFLDCGLRNFAFYPHPATWSIQAHESLFCQALQEHGHECRLFRPSLKNKRDQAWHEHQRSLKKWLRQLPRPTGIYAPGDLHAARLVDACRELDIAVPEEIAILGLGNDPVICENIRPTLSSIDPDTHRIGFEAAKRLARKMAGIIDNDAIMVPPSHVAIRQSTDLMAIDDPDMVQAVRFIREWACQKIDVSRIAEEVGLSRRVLERKFLQYLGRSPMAEIRRIRIELAKSLLARTNQTSVCIARKCCFASVPSFSKTFRREVGTTPQAYRRQRQNSRDLHEHP
jgi:LacI family transcriptional regulator